MTKILFNSFILLVQNTEVEPNLNICTFQWVYRLSRFTLAVPKIKIWFKNISLKNCREKETFVFLFSLEIHLPTIAVTEPEGTSRLKFSRIGKLGLDGYVKATSVKLIDWSLITSLIFKPPRIETIQLYMK